MAQDYLGELSINMRFLRGRGDRKYQCSVTWKRLGWPVVGLRLEEDYESQENGPRKLKKTRF